MQRRKRVDPRVIGSFVVGAILLGVAGLVFFGPGGLLTETSYYVLHFDGSVKGLSVGSPVRFRGVKIGQVKDINVQVRPSDFEFNIPVLIEIEPSRIRAEGTGQGLFDALKSSVKGDNPLQRLVDKGLRAQLQFDSLVTGRLYVNFDMYPDEPLPTTSYPSEYPVLPTISSSLDELVKTVDELPLQELTNKLMLSAEGFAKLVNSPELHNGLTRLDEISTRMDNLLISLQAELTTLSNAMQQTLQTTTGTMQHLDQKLDPISSEFTAAMRSFANASERTEQAMQDIRQMTTGDSQLQRQLTQTLQELQRAARSLRYLTTELERDPQLLLRGRGTGDQQ